MEYERLVLALTILTATTMLLFVPFVHGLMPVYASEGYEVRPVGLGLLMSVVGLVTIPGMMTGQILGGTPPLQAAAYQMLILFLIAAATALGTLVSVLAALRSLFDDAGRLRPERITPS